MAKREKNKQIEALKNRGITVYSISRLNTFNACQYAYYLSYIQKEKGKQNIYGLAGEAIHDGIELIYQGKEEKSSLKQRLDDMLTKCDLFNVHFPTETIKNNWIVDMKHFVNNFSLINKKIITEQFILYEIAEEIWVQGYIDALFTGENKTIDIIDWKSSSRFTGNKLLEAGRQLLLYKDAIEKTTNKQIGKIGWYMTKYVYICSKYKNGKTKRKMCSRRKWVKEISQELIKKLKKLGNEDFIIEILIDQAIIKNNLSNMPQKIQDEYWLEDCIVYYDYDDKKMEECRNYVIEAVKKIEGKNKDNINDWKPVEINDKNSFFCKVLCNHRETCKYLKKYLED